MQNVRLNKKSKQKQVPKEISFIEQIVAEFPNSLDTMNVFADWLEDNNKPESFYFRSDGKIFPYVFHIREDLLVELCRGDVVVIDSSPQNYYCFTNWKNIVEKIKEGNYRIGTHVLSQIWFRSTSRTLATRGIVVRALDGSDLPILVSCCLLALTNLKCLDFLSRFI